MKFSLEANTHLKTERKLQDYRTVVSNCFGTRDLLHGRQIFFRVGVGGEGWFQNDSSMLHLCTIAF